jgi:integrase
MAKAASQKPRKPRPDFPLFPHATGRWAKKIRGKMHYFGPWADPDGALARYLDQRDDLHAGRPAHTTRGELTIRDLVNRFLSSKRDRVDTGELKAKSFVTYHGSALVVADFFGKTRPLSTLGPSDFEAFKRFLAKGRGPVALGNEVRRTRTIFKYAYDADLIDAPVRFGPAFTAPGKRVLRAARHAAGPRMFEAAELRTILDAAQGQMRAMILLGINCGFGQTDVATLPRTALDLEAGWLDFPRPKTGVHRRVPLWPETVAAIEGAAWDRPKPKDPADDRLVFVTRQGRAWVRMRPKENPKSGQAEWTSCDVLALGFGKLLTGLGLKRPGLNFYALRHTFETVAGESRDQVAVDAVMGHDPGDMASRYRERISDERLKAVVEHVRAWLFGPEAEGGGNLVRGPASHVTI